MKKKLLVFLLVAAVVLGALGLNAFAGTEQQTTEAPVATALWTADGSVTVNGTASEANWMFDSWIRGASGAPDGKFAKLWNGTDLYFAVKTDGATSLKATLNTKVINVTLGSTASADVEGVVVKQSGNILEMKVPFASIGFAMHGYTQEMPMVMELTKGSGTSKFDGKLSFEGQHVANEVVADAVYSINTYDFHAAKYGYTSGSGQSAKNPTTNTTLQDALTKAQASGQVGAQTETIDGESVYHLWNKYQSGKINHMVQYSRVSVKGLGNPATLAGATMLDFDVVLADLPEVKYPTWSDVCSSTYQTTGFGVAFSRTNKSEEVAISIANKPNVGLVMYVQKNGSSYDEVALNRQISDKAMHMSIRYGKNRSMDVLIDGVLVYHNDQLPTNDNGFFGGNEVYFTLWNPAYSNSNTNSIISSSYIPLNNGYNSDVFVSNVKLCTVNEGNELEELTFDKIKGENTDAANVTENLVLPSKLEDPNGKYSAELVWSSEPAGLISATGEITAPEQTTDVVLTATVKNTSPAITKSYNLTMTVPPVDAWLADSVTVDGNVEEYYNFTRGYTFAPEAGKPSGAVAARWDKNNLYIGAKYENANVLGLQIGGKVFLIDLQNKAVTDEDGTAISGVTLAVGNGTAELALPLSKVGLSKVEKGAALSMAVILAGEAGETGKSLQLGFYGMPEQVNINWTAGATIDGKATEAAWQMHGYFSGRSGAPEGKIGRMWNEDNLFLAIDTAGATSLKLVVAGQTVEIADLTNVPASKGVATDIAKDGDTVEMKIPFESFYSLYNYGQTIPVSVELTNEMGTSGYAAEWKFVSQSVTAKGGNATMKSVNTSGQHGDAANVSAALTSGQIGYTSEADANGNYTYRLWNKYVPGKTNYGVERVITNANLASQIQAINGTITTDFDLCIEDMPVFTDPTSGYNTWRMYSALGLGISIGRYSSGEESLHLTITNMEQGLVMFVGYGPYTNTYGSNTVPYYGPYALGKQVGDQFHMTLQYTEDGKVSAYVDDQLVMDFVDGGFNHIIRANGVEFCLWAPFYRNDAKRPAGIDQILNPDHSPKNSGFDMDVVISNLKLGNVLGDDLMDGLDFDTIRGTNINKDLIMTDLTLPTVLSDGRLSTDLNWTSSNTNAIAPDGTVNTDYEGTVNLVAMLGNDTNKTKKFTLKVAMSVVDAWKGSAYTEGRGYAFTAAGKPTGEINARWDDTNLYLELENTNASKFSVAVGGKSYNANVSGGKAELKIALSTLNLGQITNTTATPAVISLTGDAGTVTKRVQMSFFGATTTMSAGFEDAVTMDGATTEGAWQFYRSTFGRPGAPMGKVAALWDKENLYLAVNTAEAIDKLNLVINGKSATVNLSTLAVTGITGVTAKKTEGAVELKIPFASVGYTLYNYGQTMPVTVELEGASGASGITAAVAFTAKEHAASAPAGEYSSANAVTEIWTGDVAKAKEIGQIGMDSTKDMNGSYTYHIWNKYQEGKANQGIQRVNITKLGLDNTLKNLSGIISIDMDLRIDDMPEYDDPTSGELVWRSYAPAGLGFAIGRYNNATEELNISVTNTKKGLALYVGYGPFTKTYGSNTVPYYGPFYIDRELGEEFHLTFHYTEDGQVSAYVDDVLVMDFQNGGYDFGIAGLGLGITLWNPGYFKDEVAGYMLEKGSAPKNNLSDSDVYLSNLKIGSVSCYDLRDLITFDTIKGLNGSPDLIAKNLTLPTTIADGNKLSAPVVWSSSNTKVITNTGVVTTQDKDVNVKLTAKVGSFTKDFDLVVVLPTVDAWRTASANVNGTLSEYHDFTRGYTFPDGSTIGARWTKNTLYIGAKYENADTLTINLGGKTITANLTKKTVSGVSGASIAVGSGTVELGIPMSQLKLGTINQGTSKVMTVTFAKGSAKVQKQLGLTFYGVYETTASSWTDGSVAIDGVLDADWLMYAETTGRVGTANGVVGSMWNGNDLYVVVDTDGADRLLVTVNGKTVTFDLTAELAASGAITEIAKGGNIVEMKISFKDFFTLVDYGQVIEAKIELENAVGASGFDGGFEIISREHLDAPETSSMGSANPVVDMYGDAEDVAAAEKSGQVGVTDDVDVNGRHTYHMWNKYQAGKQNYAVQRVNFSTTNPANIQEVTGTLTLDFDVRIDDMPVYEDPTNGDTYFRKYQANGLGILWSRGIEGEEHNFVITNTKDGLALYVGYGPFTSTYGSGTIPYDGPYLLNKALGQEFHVSVHYTEKGELALYADDKLIYKLTEVGQDFVGLGGDYHQPGLIFSIWSASNKNGLMNEFLDANSAPKNDKANSDVTISDVRIGKSSGTSILDLITYETIQGNNGDADSVVSNLTLPSTITDGKITAKLSWTSSNRGVITNGGTVYPPEERTPVTMTVSLVGAKPAITKAFELTAVMPFIDTWQTNFVKVDGDLSEYYNLTRGYTFSASSGKPSGSVAAGWNMDRSRLYYAIKYNNTTKITITMGSSIIVVDLEKQSISGVKNAQMKMGEKNTVEIAIPLERVRITEVKNNMLYDIGVKLENAKTSVSKNLTLAFYGQPSVGMASWDNGTIVLDGELTEQSWLLYSLIEGRPGTPEGSFGRLWNGTDLYLAVETDGAKKMTLQLGEKTLTVDLTKATPTASGMTGVKVAKQGDIVELKIPMKSFGFTLHNYTETVNMKMELSNSVGTSGFYGILQFSSREAVANADSGTTQSIQNIHTDTFGDEENTKAAKESGQAGYYQEKTATGYTYRMWNIYQEGVKNYPVQRISTGTSYELSQIMKTLTGNMTVDFDVRIDDMPEYKDVEIPDTFFRRYQPAGLGVFIGREVAGEEISFVITNEQGGLALYVGSGPMDNSYGSLTVKWNGPYYIGKELGQQFHVSVHQTIKGEVQIYIDDQILYAFTDVGEDFQLGDSGVGFSIWNQWYAEKYNASFINPDSSPKNADANTDVTIKNVQVGTTTCYDLLDYLDFDYIKGNNGAEDNVITDLILPTTLTDGKLKTAITWESKKPEVITNKGKVTTQSKDTTVILKASVNGTDPLVYKELSVSVALPPVDSWYNDSVAMDGKASEYHNFERGYTFDKVSGKPTGSVGAVWNDEMMYVGIKHNGADTIVVKAEGKTMTVDVAKKSVSGLSGAEVAVGDGIVELAIPRSIIREKSHERGYVDIVVTMTKGDAETEKGLRMTFYGKTISGQVGWGGDEMKVDGSISEIAYQLYGQLDGRAGTAEGLVGKVWSGKDLYLAIFTDDAKTMNITLNGKTATINPNTLSTSGNLKIASIAKGTYIYFNEKEEQVNGNLVEIKIPFANFGFDMYAYNLTADMTVEMINNVGISAYSTKMAFTNRVSKNYAPEMNEATYSNQSSGLNNMAQGVTNGNIGSTYRELQDGRFSYRMWSIYDAAAPGWAEGIASHNQGDNDVYEPLVVPADDWYMDFDVKIDDMVEKEKSGHSIANYGNDGLNFWLQRGLEGQELSCGIVYLYDTGLNFSVRFPETAQQVDFPIPRQVGDTFHVSIKWAINGDITVYIDDEELFFLEAGALGKQNKESTWNMGVLRLNLWSTSTWSRLVSEEKSTDFTVSNILIGYADSDNLLDSLTFANIQGQNRRIEEVWKDLVLPKTVTDGVIASDIVWESSNPAVISIGNGVAKVTPQDEDVKVTLTARMKGNKELYKTFEITVTCPIVDAQLTGTAKTESYKLSDGSVVAARWDKENVYLDITGKTAADLTFGDKKITAANGVVTGIEGGKAAVSGNKVTITLPRSALGITIPEYHTTQRFTVNGKVLKLEFVGYDSIADEYLASQSLKDFVATLKKVTGNIALPQTYTSQFVDGKLTMTWSSDTARVLDNNGTVKRPSKVDALVRLSLVVDDQVQATFDTNVIAESTPDLASTTNLKVPFGKDIKIDGAISEQGWSMNSYLANTQKVIGKMGAQWDTEYLYMAFDYGKAKSLTITLDGKTANINLSGMSVSGDLKIAQYKKGSYLELKIALKELGLSNIIDYGEKFTAKVMLDDATFDGTFTLSSMQWFATDNPEHRYVPRTQPNDPETDAQYSYHNWAMTDTGITMYDLYQYGKDNKAGLTTGMSFTNSTVKGTEVFAPMEQSGEVGLFVEFDFQSTSMPVMQGGVTGDNKVGSHTFMATAGLSWQIGGYANKVEKTSEWLSMGMYMTDGGLVIMVRVGKNDFYSFPTGKFNGDMFRIGVGWDTEDTLHLFIDGEKIGELEKAVTYGDTMSNGGINFRITRNANAAECESDSFKFNVSNLAMGYYYGECVLDSITFDEIRDENVNYAALTMDLNLMNEYTNPQLSSGKLTWASSGTSVAADGTVTRPEDKSYELNRLTVTNELGHSNEIVTIVKGHKTIDDMLIKVDDYDMYHGVGEKYDGGAILVFDKQNTSVIKDLKEVKPVSVVKISALERESRIDEDTITLWVSDDNENYTPVTGVKIMHKDCDTYLYGFDVEARYVKVHTTHFDDSNTMSECFFPEMVDAYYEEIFGDNGGSFGTKKTVTVKNNESYDKMDMPWTFTASELGIVSLAENMADVRIFLNDQLLYHYVEDGNVTVRIPEMKAGAKVKLKVLSGNANAMDISNKEGVYEVLYGTREMFYINDYGVSQNDYYRLRCMAVTNDGTIITTTRASSSIDNVNVDCRAWLYSKDNGRSWVYMGGAEEFLVGPAPGGMLYDSHTNILYSFGYGDHPDGSAGIQTSMVKLDLNNGIENAKWEYVACLTTGLKRAFNYNDGTLLSCYDGDGPNVDMVVAMLDSGEAKEGSTGGDASANKGDFVAYTTDAGKTWQIAESRMTIPGIKPGFEAGVSEPTTLELDDGTLVIVARYQDSNTISFAYSYSFDQGRTWADGVPSEIYSVNTQPLFLETNDEFDLFLWTGNNIQGGESYQRYPQSLAIPVVAEDYSNIKVMAVQNTYQRLYFQNLQRDNSRNTNPFLTYTHDGAVLIDSVVSPHVLTRVDDYKNYISKTKGSYDSFENTNTKYEGWCDIEGMSSVTDVMSTDGQYSMKMFGQTVRSVPYFREGSISYDLYWTMGTEHKLELETSYSPKFMYGSPAAMVIDHDGNILDGYGNDTGVDVQEGWNKIEMIVDLPNGSVTVAANGSEAGSLSINPDFDEYVTYIAMHADNYVYVDNFIQIGEPEDVRPDKKAETDAGFDLTAILLIGVPVLVAIAAAVIVIRKKKSAPKASKKETQQ